MIVTKSNFVHTMERLDQETVLALDTETTGLYPYKGDTLFSIIIAGKPGVFYFNFEFYDDDETCLHEPWCWEILRAFFRKPRRWFMQNAKFDLAFLRKEECEIFPHSEVWDTKTMGRLVWNDHMSYSLKDLAKREIGADKSDAVEKYVKEHKLFEMVEVPYKNVRERKVFYHKVPFDVIAPYGLTDGDITLRLGLALQQKIQDDALDRIRKNPGSVRPRAPIQECLSQEIALLPVVFEMESLGIQIDREYCEQAIRHEELQMTKAQYIFQGITGKEFLDSNKLFKEVFHGAPVPLTEKGNPSFDKKSLASMGENSVARAILAYREAKNQAQFFQGFLHHADSGGVVHTSFLVDGTASGRFSCSNPNLQNLTRPEDGAEGFEVRGAIIPREGFVLVEFDYKSQEYVHMLELAEAHELIPQVRAGLDIHQATADLIGRGITRQQAKTLNFALIYGAGPAKIAVMLGIPVADATKLVRDYFKAIPSVHKFIRRTISEAQDHHVVSNWRGRAFQFPNGKFAYKAPNYKIQGGCADITKAALVAVAKFLKDGAYLSRIILTVHDSIVLEVFATELHIIEQVQQIMENVYPAKHVPLKVSVEWSRKNLGDTNEWTGKTN